MNAPNPLFSVIVPVLNEAEYLPALLDYFASEGISHELILVDGGSKDKTIELLSAYKGLCFLRASACGRAAQMNEGARLARGAYLFFLHADCLPPPNALSLILQSLQDAAVVAGSFSLRFDRDRPFYRLLTRASRFNHRLTTYGDQGLFLRATTFHDLQGFKILPICEDLELQDRLRAVGKFVKRPEMITTSARRFEQQGRGRQFLRNLFIVLAYHLGVSPERLRKWYG